MVVSEARQAGAKHALDLAKDSVIFLLLLIVWCSVHSTLSFIATG